MTKIIIKFGDSKETGMRELEYSCTDKMAHIIEDILEGTIRLKMKE